MARSIAILLMLEGHFIDETLVMEVRDTSNTAYFAWQFMRHFTAPILLGVPRAVQCLSCPRMYCVWNTFHAGDLRHL
jgi:hypothetical protein